MEWLAQNWLWVAFGIGILYMMRRGGHGGGMGGFCGGGHGGTDKRTAADGSQAGPATEGTQGHHH